MSSDPPSHLCLSACLSRGEINTQRLEKEEKRKKLITPNKLLRSWVLPSEKSPNPPEKPGLCSALCMPAGPNSLPDKSRREDKKAGGQIGLIVCQRCLIRQNDGLEGNTQEAPASPSCSQWPLLFPGAAALGTVNAPESASPSFPICALHQGAGKPLPGTSHVPA